MRKTILTSAIAVTALASVNAHADIAITNVLIVPTATTYAAGGTLMDAGGGSLFSIDDFSFHSWSATQETLFMDNTGSFSGTSLQGAYDYDAIIAGMTGSQAAVGLFFNWYNSNEIAVLEIFNCAAGTCTGNGVAMANGPFGDSNPDGTPTGQGVTAVFNSAATVVPVPAAAWLMGSGLLGLVGLARRKPCVKQIMC